MSGIRLRIVVTSLTISFARPFAVVPLLRALKVSRTLTEPDTWDSKSCLTCSAQLNFLVPTCGSVPVPESLISASLLCFTFSSLSSVSASLFVRSIAELSTPTSVVVRSTSTADVTLAFEYGLPF